MFLFSQASEFNYALSILKYNFKSFCRGQRTLFTKSLQGFTVIETLMDLQEQPKILAS